MEFIASANQLESKFIDLCGSFQNFYLCTAWASANSIPFEQLVQNEHKVRQAVIGIHFYQTDPEFIRHFIDNEHIKYILQPSGTFHPKIYLFENSVNDWVILVGSANFTRAAFTVNDEAMLCFTPADDPGGIVYQSIRTYISDRWMRGSSFDDIRLAGYEVTHRNHLRKIRSLSNAYSGNEPARNIFEVPISTKSWRAFVTQVSAERFPGVEDRIAMLKLAKSLFTSFPRFEAIPTEDRKFIGGMPNLSEKQGAQFWAYFGSMKPLGVYKEQVINNNIHISQALDHIPLGGQISRRNYENFFTEFQRAFIGTHVETHNNVAAASRLLMIKRPDVFVCLDSRNRDSLCRDFGITPKHFNYERYWNDIIERIFDCEWWLNPQPLNEVEKDISDNRAALLDSLYFNQHLP